jgi:hypothetical protein
MLKAKSGSYKTLFLIKRKRSPEVANQQLPKQNVIKDRIADQSSNH